jgi:hypothetical protein
MRSRAGPLRATPELVEAIDAAEKKRGFDPPEWVDIRIQRSVRAAGFRDDAFARLLGERYIWLPDLGNARVEERQTGVQIKNPAAAQVLLDLVIASPSRRVIFFCACEHPARCHRYAVGRLLLAAARKRRVGAVVAEWPGGEPSDYEVDVRLETLRTRR